MSNGKGDAPRPLSISRKEYGERFDATFDKTENMRVTSAADSGSRGDKRKRTDGSRQ